MKSAHRTSPKISLNLTPWMCSRRRLRYCGLLLGMSPLRFLFILLWCTPAFASLAEAATEEVTIKIRNESGESVVLYWVHPTTMETVKMKDIPPGPRPFIMNSFLHHRFQIYQIPDEETGSCGSDQTCKTDYFQITQTKEQSFIISEDLTIVPDASQTAPYPVDNIDMSIVQEPSSVFEKCKAQATQIVADGLFTMDDVIKDLYLCTTMNLVPKIKSLNDEVEFERELRATASINAENFTCTDPNLESSPDVRTELWTSPKDNVSRVAHIKLDRPTSRIHVVENFASTEECHAMEEEARDKLRVASTADGKGGSKVSEGRKALQAAINPKFTKEGEPVNGNLIAVLSSRVYEYVNHVLNLNLTHHGQEPLMSIQYFGRGYNDTKPDRYTPHCDGKCLGEPHIDGARMATMVIYCTIPEKGGFTNFQNANVQVKPSQGSAIFFSYIDPITNITDFGLTQHSGCPVYSGEKKIITQWVRYGVSSAIPHSSFNTLNILSSEDGE